MYGTLLGGLQQVVVAGAVARAVAVVVVVAVVVAVAVWWLRWPW